MARLVNLMVRCGADFSSLTKATKKAQTSMSSLQRTSGLLKKSLGALGLTLSAAAVIGFGKACVDAASDLQEVQNVVDVTFGSMSKKIDDFARTSIQRFGLSEKAAKQYSGTMGAMLKSMGLSTEQAADMSMTITGLAGDMASFYNLNADDAFAKIRSGISGEVEPLRQLGINLSIANLETFAMSKGITKAYNAMRPAEQAVLRYNYLISATADAQGDFSRTSNSWANQTRILAEQFNQLKVALGQGLIQALTPVITVINQVMAKLVELAQFFSAITAKLFGKQTAAASANADAVETAAQAQNNLAGGISNAGKAAEKEKKKLAGFDELNILQGNESQASTGGGGIGGLVGQTPVIPEIEGVAAAWDAANEQLKKSVSKTLLIMAGAGLAIGALLTFSGINIPLGIALMAVGAASLAAAVGINWDSIKTHISGSLAILETLLGSCLLGIGAVLAFTGASIPLGVAMMAIGAIGLIRSQSVDWSLLSTALQGSLGKITTVVSGALLAIGLILACSGVSLPIGIGMIFAGCAGLVTTASVNWDSILKKLKDVWSGIQQWFGSSVEKCLSLEYWNSKLSPIKDAFAKMGEWIVFQLKGCWNDIAENVNALIYGIVVGINSVIGSMNQISFDIPDWVPWFGGMHVGVNIPPITSYPQIPYLASGAVIPPNSEFLAVLGDQSHGTNIEAPLDTIKQAVAEVVGGDRELMREQNQLLRQILAKSGTYLDGKEVASWLAPHQRDLERARGW